MVRKVSLNSLIVNYILLQRKYLPMRIGTSEEGGEGDKFRH